MSGICREENDVRKEVSGRTHHILSIGRRQGAFSFNKIQITGNPELLEREIQLEGLTATESSR